MFKYNRIKNLIKSSWGLALLIFGALNVFSNIGLASTHCLSEFSSPPCNGAPGKCVFNSVGEKNGGFVADTAQVALNINGLSVPFIGKSAQVCGQATVINNAKIYGKAKVGDYAFISENSEIFDDAVVEGNARTKGNAAIYGDAKIKDDVVVGGMVQVATGTLGGTAFLDGFDVLDKPFTFDFRGPIYGLMLSKLTLNAVQARNTSLFKIITNQVGFDIPNNNLDAEIALNPKLENIMKRAYLRPNESPQTSLIVRLTTKAMQILIDYYYGINAFKVPPIPANSFDVFEKYLVSVRKLKGDFKEFFIIKPINGIHFQPVYVAREDNVYKIVLLDSLARPDAMTKIKTALSNVKPTNINIIFLNEQRQYDPGMCSCFSLNDFIAFQALGDPFQYFLAKAGAPILDPASGLNYLPISLKDLPPDMLKLTQSLSALRRLDGVLDENVKKTIWAEINHTQLFGRDPRDEKLSKQLNGIVYQNFRANEMIIKSELLLDAANAELIATGFYYVHPTLGLGRLEFVNDKIRTRYADQILYSQTFTFIDGSNNTKNAKIDPISRTFRLRDSLEDRWGPAQDHIFVLSGPQGPVRRISFNPSETGGIFITKIERKK